MTTKEIIHRLVDEWDEGDAVAVLACVQSLAGEDLPRGDEAAEAALPRRPIEWMKIGKPTSEDDPLWRIVGIVGDESEGPTDVARNHDKDLAEAYEDWRRR